MRKTYVLTRDVRVPIVVSSGTANRAPIIRYKTYRRGEMVQGELKHSNNKPAFVLVGKMQVIPIDSIQEVMSAPITSGADGATTESKAADSKNKSVIIDNPKVKYGDAMIIGGVVGFLLTHLAVKKEYIKTEDKHVKIYGAVAGGLLGMYLVYRMNSTSKPVVKSKKE